MTSSADSKPSHDNDDPGHSQTVGTYIQSTTQDDDHDDLIEQLERDIDDDFDLATLREKRIQEMQSAIKQAHEMVERGYRELREITEEKEVLRISANEKRCVIHFYHKDFKRCEIMNQHLETLARKYVTTRFVKVFVENIPWLVEKLEIKMLPCVVCFIDGYAKARMVGFEALGNKDDFQTAALDLWLQQTGVVVPPPKEPRQRKGDLSPPRTSKIRNSATAKTDDDDDDWD